MSNFANTGSQPQFTVAGLRGQLPAVKQLFLSGQHRQCAAASQSLLLETTKNEPQIHIAFLHFYAALSHHELSRNMHHLNEQRKMYLGLAEKHYTSAIASLSVLSDSAPPDLETIPELDHSEDDESTEGSINPSNRSSLNYKRSSLDSALTDHTSVCSDDESESAFPPTPKMFYRSPPSRNFLDDLVLSPQKSHGIHSLHSCSNTQTERYNVHLTSFVNTLYAHITAVRSLREAHVTEPVGQSISQGWYTVANTTTGRQCSGMPKSTAQTDQLVQGRAKLLPRKRFDHKKYEELCRKALAEL